MKCFANNSDYCIKLKTINYDTNIECIMFAINEYDSFFREL